MSLSVINLTKEYGTQKAVNNISFEATQGQILGFLGPNGAGKSTTMKIATSYLSPSAGTVEICGIDVVKSPLKAKELVGYLPEHNPLYLDMYVHEYLRFVASMHSLIGKNATHRIAEVVELVGLTKEQHKPISALSKGYRQRVGLAQALVHNPPVLILDEPTTGLDPNQILEIRSVIKAISAQKTVVFSTHILQEVQALCDRVVIINEGVLVANGSLAELSQAGQRIRIMYEGIHDVQALSSIAGVQRIEAAGDGAYWVWASLEEEVRGQIFRSAAQRGETLIEMVQEKESLEHLFRKLTGKAEVIQ